jgi:hypothetical protein
MKSKDIGLIAVIAIISGGISILLSNMFIASPENRRISVDVVSPISPDFQNPPTEYFNAESINPTRLIQISEDPNSKPFE